MLRKVVETANCAHLTASNLIKEQMTIENGQKSSSEDLRTGDLSSNQDYLGRAFQRHAKSNQFHILLDCHTVIDTPAGLQVLPKHTFESLGLTHFLFLYVDPQLISKRRQLDTGRQRPFRDPLELQHHQEIGLKTARDIADSLGLPFEILTDQNAQAKLLKLVHSPD